ncbi:hypothetical protein ACHAQE_007675 [Botrytis cinerea]
MNSTPMNNASKDASPTPASTSSSPKDALKHDIEFDNNDEQQPTKRARREDVPLAPLKKSTDHPQRKVHGKSKPLLFTTSRVESSTSHVSGGLPDVSRGHSSTSPPDHDHHMVDSVTQDTAYTACRGVLKEQDHKFLQQLLQQKDDEIRALKIKLEVREEFDNETVAREEELKDTIEKYRSDAEYWRGRSTCGLESFKILQDKHNILEVKLEAVSTESQVKNKSLETEREAVKADLQEQSVLAAKQETEKAELQEKYDTLQDKYRTLKAMGTNKASYVLYEGRKTPELISVNYEISDEELAEKRTKLADENAAEMAAEILMTLYNSSNNGAYNCDTPIDSIEVVPEDMGFNEKLVEETSDTVSRSSNPKRTGSSVPFRYVTPSVTPQSPDPSNTYESNCRLWDTPERPLFPGPFEESP